MENVHASSENAAKIRIYFDQVNYEIVEELPSYQQMDLFLGVVNSVALWLGMSLVSLVEVGIILVQIFLAIFSSVVIPGQCRLQTKVDVYNYLIFHDLQTLHPRIPEPRPRRRR
jgi:hypothetical protein